MTWAAGLAVVLVVGLIAVIVAVSSGRDGGAPSVAAGSAGAVVQDYLKALAAGDAAAALAYSDARPKVRELLTDDVLRQQIDQWPITNIRIVSDDSADGVANVHVRADFGATTSDATLRVRKSDTGQWKLPTPAIKVAGSDAGIVPAGAAETTTLFGKPIPPNGTYVFPGYLDIGSSSPFLEVGAAPTLLLDTLNLPFSEGLYVGATFDLNDGGRRAVQEAITTAYAACQDSSLLRPEDCATYLEPEGLVNGTVSWGEADTSGVRVEKFEPLLMWATVRGSATRSVSVREVGGATTHKEMTFSMDGNVDFDRGTPTLVRWTSRPEGGHP
ncbi:MAG: hypothetical protein K0U76_08370 [Actinomycetia bacterium]|nr:hypothetical protein [Actinomycetes bacterium]MCH9761755.1 hypothetical protein [Actinomycetes bacterium]